MRILAISGSLRAASSNTEVLRAAALLAPDGVEVALYGGLGGLPHFNPDLDGDAPPAPVRDLRARVQGADALLVCSPEYAHGVPGSLKNALDWMVGSGELMAKPVGLVNAAPRGWHAQASLTETLTVMTAVVPADACVAVPLAGRGLDAAGIAADAELSAALRGALAALLRAAEERPAPGGGEP